MDHRFTRIAAALALLLAFAVAGDARTRKGDKLLAEGKKAEAVSDWDKALQSYQKAFAEDPSDQRYDMAVKRARFQAAEAHIHQGRKLRDQGELEKALAEFEKAYAIDPSSAMAEQELKRTLEMIERAKKGAQTGQAVPPDERILTPGELEKKREGERLARLEAAPELKSFPHQPISLRMSNQPPKVLFETVGKLAGINVIFDPDYGTQAGMQGPPPRASIELTNATLEDALDYLAASTHSFWKPMSSNGIFVTQDNPQKRREYEDNVVKVFYLTNVNTPQELQEIVTAVRTVCGVQKIFTYSGVNAVIVRGTPDQILLSEKLVNDLDKPRSEVVVDVLVMEANRSKTRNLAAAIASNGAAGINTAINFTPRNPVLLGGTSTTGTDTSGSSTTGSSTTSGTTTSATQQLISLARISKISTNDYSITMPGALLQATMSDSNTKVLQSPQVRASNGQKASLHIGEKYPIASGGIQPLGSTVGSYGGLYQNFQFIDIGVNVDLTPTIHGDKEVTLKLAIEISSVADNISIGGISQPVVAQQKIDHEIRIREGEVSVIGGLMQDTDSKSNAGVPGLMNIPGLKWLFSSQTMNRQQTELLICLIPHIVRSPVLTDVNLRTIEAGTDQVTRLSLASKPDGPPAAPPAVPGAQPAPSPAAASVPPPLVQPVPMHLMFRPSGLQVQNGATFTLQLDADNATDLSAMPFHLKFDPQLLKLQEIRPGNLLSSDGQQVVFTRNILNDTGDATVELKRLPGTPGVKGSGTVAVFTFQAAKPGVATVTFSELNARDSQNRPASREIPQVSVTIK